MKVGLSDFSGFIIEKKILVTVQIFLRETVKQNATHLEKNHNKHKKKGNFATHSNRKVFMICYISEDKHKIDDCKSFKEKVLQDRRKFLFEQKLCYCCLSSSLTQRQTCQVKPASPNTSICKGRRKSTKGLSLWNSEDEFGGNKYVLVSVMVRYKLSDSEDTYSEVTLAREIY